MAYDLYDFTESMTQVDVNPGNVAACILGFGDSPEGYASWEGGFLLHMKAGEPYALVTGWCDTTGWGCQDGAQVDYFDHEPTLDEIRAAWTAAWGGNAPLDDPDEMPTDVNRYLAGEIDRWGAALDKGV